MEQLNDFIGRHWLLALIFVVLVLVLVVWEQRGKIKGARLVSPAELVDKVNHQKAVLVDLRDGSAFAQGHIAGAISFSTTDVDSLVKKLKIHKNTPLILYGSPAQLTSQIISRLKQEGVTDLYLLADGIKAWSQSGLPLVKE